jgi:hypothetical protein
MYITCGGAHASCCATELKPHWLMVHNDRFKIVITVTDTTMWHWFSQLCLPISMEVRPLMRRIEWFMGLPGAQFKDVRATKSAAVFQSHAPISGSSRLFPATGSDVGYHDNGIQQ